MERVKTMYALLVIIIGYLFGCIHGSQIVGKLKKVNIKKNGMKNAGATNTTLLLGWKLGLFVAFIDVFKAVISMTLTAIILEKSGIILEHATLLIYINALFVIIGHNYPLTMNFDGGKGTASFFGVLLVLNPLFAVISLVLLLLFAIVTNYFVIGTLFTYIGFIMFTSKTYTTGPILISILFILIFFIKHMENFKRIIKNKEVKLSSIYRNEAS